MHKPREYYVNKNKLAVEDYKIIKTAEHIIKEYVKEKGTAGLPYPDIVEKIAARDLLREKINELE